MLYPVAIVRDTNVPRIPQKQPCSFEDSIAVETGAKPLKTEGETIVVNLHGALVSTTSPLSLGLDVSIHVHLTDKRARARIVYVDPENPLRCGMELDQPRNIWGVPLPPSDWDETAEFGPEHPR